MYLTRPGVVAVEFFKQPPEVIVRAAIAAKRRRNLGLLGALLASSHTVF